MSIPIFPGVHRPPKLRRRHLTAMRQRAHELALIAYQEFMARMMDELDAGTLDQELVQFWEPRKE